MYHQHVQLPPAPRPSVSQPQPVRHEISAPTAPVESSNVRKRPLCPSTDRPQPLAPRAIQPRPVSHSRGDSSSTIVSPSGEEPARKRGRPSKVETERRRAAAEAKGESYPTPRRGSGRSKISSTPTSPPGSLAAMGPSYSPPQASSQGPGSDRFKLEPRYAPPPSGRSLEPAGFGGDEQRSRDIRDHDPRPANRELPRPVEIRQPLPSPQELQLGHPDTIPRISTAEPSFGRFPPGRVSRAFDSARHVLADPVGSRRSDRTPVSGPSTTLETPGDKPSG